MGDFVIKNYQQVTWFFIITVFIIVLGLFIWWLVSRKKEKKNTKFNLLKKRKEILFEVIKGGKELDDDEAAKLLDLKPKDAHKYLFELAKEKKIMIHGDIGQGYIYKLNVKKNK